MAKVMISMPDALLRRIDGHAQARGESRSGFLRRVAEAELNTGEAKRREEIRELLDLATSPMGGEGVRLIREDRESH